MKEFQEKLKEWGKIIKLLFVRYLIRDIVACVFICIKGVGLLILSTFLGKIACEIFFALKGKDNDIYEIFFVQSKFLEFWMYLWIGAIIISIFTLIIYFYKQRIEEVKKELEEQKKAEQEKVAMEIAQKKSNEAIRKETRRKRRKKRMLYRRKK